jgi:GAF domain-containing protein
MGLLTTIANQAAIAIENTRLYGEARELAALQERQRLAREMHDSVTQQLFSASLNAEVLLINLMSLLLVAFIPSLDWPGVYQRRPRPLFVGPHRTCRAPHSLSAGILSVPHSKGRSA